MTRKKAPEREVKFPIYKSELLVGDTPMTYEKMKSLLGWEEVETKDDSCVPEIYQLLKKHVRLRNNTVNRPWIMDQLLTIKQEVLNKQWVFNFETFGISKYGSIMSGQHRGIGFIAAVEEWRAADEDHHWRQLWKTEPTIEMFVGKGLEETDKVFQTLNQSKPATAGDVFYRSHWFENKKPAERRELSKALDWAVKFCWDRTGEKKDPYSPRRTPAESSEWVANHPRLVQAVKHIGSEDQKKVSYYLSPGYSSGMLYLMACCGSDGNRYRSSEHRTDKQLDWDYWDQACSFWTEMYGAYDRQRSNITRDTPFDQLYHAHRPGNREDDSGYLFEKGVDGGTPEEKKAVIIRAWHRYLNDENMTDLLTEEDYRVTDDGRVFDAEVTIGGIDYSGETPEPTGELNGDSEEEQAEVERRKAEAKLQKENGQQANPYPNKSASMNNLIDWFKTETGDKVILFRGTKGALTAWGEDATLVAQTCKTTTRRSTDGLMRANISAGNAMDWMKKLLDTGKQIAICDQVDGKPIILDPEEAIA